MLFNMLNIFCILCVALLCSAEEFTVSKIDSIQGSFEKVGELYYYFGKEKVTWYEALAKCRSVGGFLGSIEGSSEAFALTDHLIDNHSSTKLWWLSGADFHKKGDFYWYGIGNSFSNYAWYKGRPVAHPLNKNCVRFRHQGRNYDMENWSCNRTAYYLCEFEKPKTVIDGELEDKSTPFEKVGEKFYFFSKERSSWHKAFLSCRSMGSNLASISGSSEMEELSDHLVKGNSSLKQWWVSGAKFDKDTNFVWYGTGRELSYTNWSEFLSSELENINRCVQLWYEDFGYKMAVFPCNVEFHYICEITKSN